MVISTLGYVFIILGLLQLFILVIPCSISTLRTRKKIKSTDATIEKYNLWIKDTEKHYPQWKEEFNRLGRLNAFLIEVPPGEYAQTLLDYLAQYEEYLAKKHGLFKQTPFINVTVDDNVEFVKQ